MLDKPEKTARLMATLKAAIPFEVELLPSTLARIRKRSPNVPIGAREMVFDVTNEPKHGGILCLIRPAGTNHLVATSITHVRVPRSLSFSAAVADYQKHRLKKLRQKREHRKT